MLFFFHYFSARLKRKNILENDLKLIKQSTPSLKQGSSQTFRNLRDKGMNKSYIAKDKSILFSYFMFFTEF